MSNTALVRSSSSSNSLIPSTSQLKQAAPSPSQLKQATPSPSAIASSILPKLNLTSTPLAKTSTPQQQPSPAPSTPGRWQHPRMDEVIQRQSKTNFDKSNVRIITYNVSLLLTTLLLSNYLPNQWLTALRPWPTYTFLLLRAFFIINIGLALTPLFRQPDTCEDVPLTPAQRQLLGLPPQSRPATPLEQAQWVTPPRYSRSATPNSRSSSVGSLRAEISGSPLNGRGTPLSSSASQMRTVSGSPQLTPRGGGSGAERRRLSYNQPTRGSPLSTGEFDSTGSIGTPTKINNRASVGLNSKWLYEKGRASPVLSGAWGTGSVFT